MTQAELIKKINHLKKEKNAIILAHCYQRPEIDFVADFVGDSLSLSHKASSVDADIILFAGVTFMAETAKILSFEKKVLYPNKDAGCLMADMINLDMLNNFKKQHPGMPVVCYVNSSAEIKANSDICCTSANAIEVVKSLNTEKVLFVPDRGLGSYVNSMLKDTEVICFSGCCPIHMTITPKDIQAVKEKYPDAKVLVHPECSLDVIQMADCVGSTTKIMEYAKNSSDKQFIIVTEKGVVDRLNRDYPEKEFVLGSEKAICQNMKCNTLEDILYSLENECYEVNLDENVAKAARSSIERMLAI